MVMRERELEREAKAQAIERLRSALGAIPRQMIFARKQIGDAIKLLEGWVLEEEEEQP